MNEQEVSRRSKQFMESSGFYYALTTEDAEVRVPLVSQKVFIDAIYKKKDFSNIILLENTGNHSFEQIRSHFGRLAYALTVYGCVGILAVQDKAKKYLKDLEKYSQIVYLNPAIQKRLLFLTVGNDEKTAFKLLNLNGKRRTINLKGGEI